MPELSDYLPDMRHYLLEGKVRESARGSLESALTATKNYVEAHNR